VEGESEPTEWHWSPLPPDTHRYVELGALVVDGETFAVRRRDDGSIHYDWISGPNDGYGFSVLGATGTERGNEYHVAHIRDFLAGIDPATGYLSYP